MRVAGTVLSAPDATHPDFREDRGNVVAQIEVPVFVLAGSDDNAFLKLTVDQETSMPAHSAMPRIDCRSASLTFRAPPTRLAREALVDTVAENHQRPVAVRLAGHP